MHLQPKQQVIQKCKEFYVKVVRETKPNPFILNVSLASNPFVKDRQAFKLLKFQLNEYNKRVQKGQVKDKYEMLSYQKMHSLLSDIALMETRDDQITALDDLCNWFKQQNRLLQQRQDQGKIRYQMSKEYRDALKNMPTKEVMEEQKELQIPFYIIERIMQPFRRHSRTLHSQLDTPDRRILQFKGKTINIPTFADQKDQIKPTRVLYPRPPKYEPPKEQQPQNKPTDQQNLMEGTTVEGQPAQGAQAAQPQANAPEQPGMDLGIGQQPQQPDEDEPLQEAPDKLKPKNPIYIEGVSVNKQKKYKEGYMFFEGKQSKQERNMEMRYLRKYQDILRKQREEVQQIQIAHQWARKKAKMSKDIQRKLEEFKFKPDFSFSSEPIITEQRLAPQDQIKYGLTTIVRQKYRTNQVDLTLPQLRNNKTTLQLEQKSIRRERLNSLRSKFAKVLNLTQQESRQSAPSLCQFTARRRGLSQIIRNHSQSKERLNQLEEVGKIKQKLTKVKVNINIKALSKGLCLPEDEHYFIETTRQFPNKQLPSNPDLIEKKKKKKKK